MTASRVIETVPPGPAQRSDVRSSRLHASDLLVPASIVLWAYGLRQTHAHSSQPFGLITSLPAEFYAGLLLLVISAVLELRQREPSQWRLAVHAVVLVVMLFATAPIVYSAGRYAWLYKTIGVVQYVNAHGRLNDQIDIYQNWPGFFAIAAWFGKIAGVASPLSYAKWAQLVFELAALPLLYLIYDALGLPVRQRWVALMAYTASNWIGQDYYSPQALGTILSLGVMALAMRWLYIEKPPRRWRGQRAHHRWRRFWTFPQEIGVPRGVLVCCTIMFVYFVLSMTHQLSPYMVAVQLGALAFTGRLRPGWLPVVLLGIAAGYLLPHYGFVNSHFGLLSSLGSFFKNVKPPSLATAAISAQEKVIAHCAEALSLGVWGLAVLGAWFRRRAGRDALGLLLLAFSPVLLLALQAYGQEGILRLYLFSLPWSAALAACALLPLPVADQPKTHRVHDRARDLGQGRNLGAVRVFTALIVMIGLFFPAFFGGDAYNVMPVTEVTTVTSFLQNAPAGTIYAAIENAPFQDTSRYDQFPITPIFGVDGLFTKTKIGPNIASVILNNALFNTPRSQPDYIVITSSMVHYNSYYQYAPADAFATLEQSLSRSRLWVLVVHQGGTFIYELPPRVLPVRPSKTEAPHASS